MTSMETKKILNTRISKIEQKLKEIYPVAFQIRGQNCYEAGENEYFMITGLSWANAVVVEHAFSVDEATKNRFEDGDLFYMDELSEDEMLNAMIKEIEEV